MHTAEEVHQKDLERIQKLRYMDDDFMTACLDGYVEGVELILRIVIGKDLTVQSVQVQETLKNLQGRSAVLDVHAVDDAGKEYDVEIQRSDAGTGAKRARHNSSLLDAHILKAGEDTEKIPDSYVIFITENDVMKRSLPIYRIERKILETDEFFGDGSHILYVNGTYRGNDEVGKLMHNFSCANPDEMNYEALARKARYFKKEEKGVSAMCKMLEEMRKEAAKEAARETELRSAKETAERLIKKGKMSLEDIAECVPAISLKELKAIKADVMQMV